MYVTDLEIEDFRGISRSHVQLLHPDREDAESLEMPNVNLLVGLNGGGKSTFLKAIAAGIVGPLAEDPAMMPASWVRRRGSGTATVRVGLGGLRREKAGDEPEVARLTTRITRSGARYQQAGAAPRSGARRGRTSYVPLLVAYGAARSWGSGGKQSPSSLHSRVGNLLDDAPLTPLGWMQQLRGARKEETLAILHALVPPDTRFTGRREGDEYLFANRDLEVPFSALSDGLKGHIAWVADLLFHLNQLAPRGTELASLPGILLVDEVDQRLHPRWQLRVLQAIAAALPRLQFIGSSHSPLIAGSLRPENLLLLEPDRDSGPGATHARRLHEDIFGYPSDRVLTSSYFDLDSTRAAAFRAHLRKLVERARGDDPDAPLDFMRALALRGDRGRRRERGRPRRRKR